MHETLIIKKAAEFKIPNFLGTFPIDRLPTPKQFPSCFILNHDKMNQPGTHWVAVIITRENTVEYYDSLANKPPNELYQWNKQINFNRKPTQFIFSDTCGHHALYYLYLRLVLNASRAETLKLLYSCKNLDSYVKKFIML